MRPVRRAILALVCGLALTACAEADPGAEPAAKPVQESTEPAQQDAPEQDVPKSLRFSARMVGGTSFDAKTLAGKDAVLWFWAPWCGECRREAPHVAAVQKATGDKVTFVGVAGLGPVKDMKAFVTDYKVGAFEHLADLDGKIWQRFGVVQQPAHAFIDDDGSVKLVRGELDRQGLAKRVDALIAD